MPTVKLTKRFIDSAPAPTDKSQEFYRDAECRYLCLRVMKSGLKTFVFEGKTGKGTHARRVLGQYGALTLEQARAETISLMQQFQQGENPFEEAASLTLQCVYQDYITVRPLAPRTLAYYEAVLRLYLADWKDKNLNDISKAMVQQRYMDIKQHSPSQANKAMRALRALFRFAHYQYEHAGKPLVNHNPVDIISHTRVWATIARRQSYIPEEHLKTFYDGLNAFIEPNDYYCRGHNDKAMIVDYLLLLLFHGLRAGEASMIAREHISFEGRTLTLPAAQTKARREVVLPLSDFSAVLLRRRVAALKDNERYLFHNSHCDKPLDNIKKPLMWIKEQTGLEFCLHDLRRTFVTIAEHLDISAYTIKMLVNHRLPSNDVTAGYIIMRPERIRAAIQQIADYLQRAMGMINDGVVSISSIRSGTDTA